MSKTVFVGVACFKEPQSPHVDRVTERVFSSEEKAKNWMDQIDPRNEEWREYLELVVE